jgi:tRNA dimethylallyltransferase
MMEKRGIGYMWDRLNRVDREYAAKIGKNDRIRIVRGLEIFYNNNIKPTDIFQKSVTPFKHHRFIRIGLNMRREALYDRINRRVENMIKKGLVEEVKKLCRIYPADCPPFQSLGYKEVLMMLNGELKQDEMISLIQQRTRHFAKRQLSWFRQEKDIHWFHPDQLQKVLLFLQKRLI